MKKYNFDRFLTITLIMILLFACILFFIKNFHKYPFEDAAILFRYAENFANGYGIVWNNGELPYDGASDILYLLILSPFYKVGFSLETASIIINLTSQCLTAIIIFFSISYLFKSSKYFAFIFALFFMLGPGIAYTNAYFGTAFNAFILSSSSFFLHLYLFYPKNKKITQILFLVFSMLSIVARIEFIVLIFAFIASASINISTKERKQFIKVALISLLIFFTSYLFFRYLYFGSIFPSPYVNRGDFTFYPNSLENAFRASYNMLFPLIFLILFSLRSKSAFKSSLLFIIPFVFFISIWGFYNNEMNFLARHQYAVFPLFFINLFTYIKDLQLDYNLPSFKQLNHFKKIPLVLILCLVLFFIFNQQTKKYSNRTYQDGRANVGILLSQYKSKGYVLATAEAGLVPYFSKWKCYELWGLCNRDINKGNMINADYLKKVNPDIIQLHKVDNITSKNEELKNDFKRFQKVIIDFAQDSNYIHIASFGVVPDRTHTFWVRSGLTDTEEIIEGIRNINYFFYGKKAIIYENLP